MAADNKKAPGVQALLDVDFVPMAMAAAMAYFDITAHRKVVGSEAHRLTTEEINERLFKARPASLDDLAIRRDDLQKAIATLKEARATFGAA